MNLKLNRKAATKHTIDSNFAKHFGLKKMQAEYQKLFYSNVLSQAISDCGEFLFAGTNFGDIFVFRFVLACF